MKKIIKSFLTFLLYSVLLLPQQKTATYKDLSPNIFASYKQPIGIGILKFEGSNDLHTKLYEELKIQSGIHEKFTIFPYDVLEQQKGALRIKGEITPDNVNAMRQIRTNLEIELVISGSYINDGEFLLRLYKTSDEQKVFENRFENSSNSTSFTDVIKFFLKKQVSTYEKVECPQSINYSNKTYHTILIGAQCWIEENLNIGTMIYGSQNAINNGVIEKFCYNDDLANCSIYGGLYQWDEAMQYSKASGSKGICPPGWHLPSKSEIKKLEEVLSLNSNSNTRKTKNGFSKLLAGSMSYSNFRGKDEWSYFSSSTECEDDRKGKMCYTIQLFDLSSNILLGDGLLKDGYSVRCLKD